MMAFVIIITEILLVNSKKKKTTTKITGKEKIKSPINDAKKKKEMFIEFLHGLEVCKNSAPVLLPRESHTKNPTKF